MSHILHTPHRGILKGGPQLADRAETADHIHKNATDRYAPCLRALLSFARPIVNIGDFYYCVVLTILNVIPNGITCIYKIIEINLNIRPYQLTLRVFAQSKTEVPHSHR